MEIVVQNFNLLLWCTIAYIMFEIIFSMWLLDSIKISKDKIIIYRFRLFFVSKKIIEVSNIEKIVVQYPYSENVIIYYLANKSLKKHRLLYVNTKLLQVLALYLPKLKYYVVTRPYKNHPYQIAHEEYIRKLNVTYIESIYDLD